MPASTTDAHAAETPQEPQRLLDVQDAMRILAVSRTTVYELMTSGRIESVTIGRSRRIPVDAIDRYITSLRAGDMQ